MPLDHYAGSGGPLKVILLGDVRVELGGRRLPGFESTRLQRLLAYLSFSEGHSRARLAYELWPDSTESQALGNLRKLVYDLRLVLPEADAFLEVTQQTLRWRPAGPVAVDLVEFRQLLNTGDLAGAVSRYGGDLVPGSYDDRILAERERLRTEAAGAFLRLAAKSSESGDHASAAGFARRALGIDNLSEPAYRALMTACARLGDRVEAYRTYHRCVEVLRKELGVEPDVKTRAVYEGLGAGASAGGPMPQPGTSRFVGRRDEFRRALDAWRLPGPTRAHLLLVTGEPGIGKSRLVEELAGMALGEGAAVAHARAYQAAGRPPWGPVIDWLRSPALKSPLDRLEEVWRLELARLVPELRRPDEADRELSADAEAGRRRLFDALGRVFAGGNRPLLLVLDDLQWCDRETIELIGHLLAGSTQGRLLIAATLRSDEVDPPGPLHPLRTSSEREGLLTEIELGRLDSDSSAELASGLLGRQLTPADAKRLWSDTEGQPLFIVEAARTGLSATGPSSFSRTVRAIISSRLSQLSDPARRLVEAAATVGRSFSPKILAEVVGSTEDELVDALDEAWRRQILREQNGGYDFSHDRIREVAYDLIAPARRRSLHRAAAAALEGEGSGMDSAIAVHYEAAGMVSEAVAAHLRAGRRSVEVFALDDAIGTYRRALLLLERVVSGRVREEAELELRMALAVPLVAREGYGSDAVQDCYARATVLCERLGRPAWKPRFCGGWVWRRSCRAASTGRRSTGSCCLGKWATTPRRPSKGTTCLGWGPSGGVI